MLVESLRGAEPAEAFDADESGPDSECGEWLIPGGEKERKRWKRDLANQRMDYEEWKMKVIRQEAEEEEKIMQMVRKDE